MCVRNHIYFSQAGIQEIFVLVTFARPSALQILTYISVWSTGGRKDQHLAVCPLQRPGKLLPLLDNFIAALRRLKRESDISANITNPATKRLK
jgi:hypothetical protein